MPSFKKKERKKEYIFESFCDPTHLFINGTHRNFSSSKRVQVSSFIIIFLISSWNLTYSIYILIQYDLI